MIIERWGLSWRGRLIILSIGLAAAGVLFFDVYPFLAVTRRVDTTILVVEGWGHGYAARAAAAEFKAGSYQRQCRRGALKAGWRAR